MKFRGVTLRSKLLYQPLITPLKDQCAAVFIQVHYFWNKSSLCLVRFFPNQSLKIPVLVIRFILTNFHYVLNSDTIAVIALYLK